MFLRFEPKTSGNTFSVKKSPLYSSFSLGKRQLHVYRGGGGGYYGVKADIQRRLRINKL